MMDEEIIQDGKHTASREIIWHLGCANCGNWWSYATMESRFAPKRMTCPHCSHNAQVQMDLQIDERAAPS